MSFYFGPKKLKDKMSEVSSYLSSTWSEVQNQWRNLVNDSSIQPTGSELSKTPKIHCGAQTPCTNEKTTNHSEKSCDVIKDSTQKVYKNDEDSVNSQCDHNSKIMENIEHMQKSLHSILSVQKEPSNNTNQSNQSSLNEKPESSKNNSSQHLKVDSSKEDTNYTKLTKVDLMANSSKAENHHFKESEEKEDSKEFDTYNSTEAEAKDSNNISATADVSEKKKESIKEDNQGFNESEKKKKIPINEDTQNLTESKKNTEDSDNHNSNDLRENIDLSSQVKPESHFTSAETNVDNNLDKNLQITTNALVKNSSKETGENEYYKHQENNVEEISLDPDTIQSINQSQERSIEDPNILEKEVLLETKRKIVLSRSNVLKSAEIMSNAIEGKEDENGTLQKITSEKKSDKDHANLNLSIEKKKKKKRKSPTLVDSDSISESDFESNYSSEPSPLKLPTRPNIGNVIKPTPLIPDALPLAGPSARSIGFSFSPAGLLLPYHLGVASILLASNYLTPDTKIAGASAGALVVACIACNISIPKCLQLLYDVEHNLRLYGAVQRLHSQLKLQLDKDLPDDAATLINKRPGKTSISYTQVWPSVKGIIVSEVESKAELSDCLCASCNIPFYFSTWPTVTVRGTQAVDGYFVCRKTFGCPPTQAKRDVYVIPFPRSAVKLKFKKENVIFPQLQLCDQYLIKVTNNKIVECFYNYIQKYPCPADLINVSENSFNTKNVIPVELDENESKKSTIQNPQVKKKKFKRQMGRAMSPSTRLAKMWNISEIDSGLVNNKSQLPTLQFKISKLLNLALYPTSVETIQHLFDLGRADAFRWIYLQKYGYPDNVVI